MLDDFNEQHRGTVFVQDWNAISESFLNYALPYLLCDNHSSNLNPCSGFKMGNKERSKKGA